MSQWPRNAVPSSEMCSAFSLKDLLISVNSELKDF